MKKHDQIVKEKNERERERQKKENILDIGKQVCDIVLKKTGNHMMFFIFYFVLSFFWMGRGG